MALINVLQYRGPENAIIWKWSPSHSFLSKRDEQLRIGTQLVVGPSFVAVFVSGGRVADIFGPGTYTIMTKNLPLLDKIISLPFGEESPFKAEVYYINKAVLMDTPFEVSTFNMPDPNFKVPIPISCSGSFAIRAGEAKMFLQKMLGSLSVLSTDAINNYFRGIITEQVKSAIGQIAKTQKYSPMEMESSCAEVSSLIRPIITDTIAQYGLHLELLNIENITIDDSNPRVKTVIEEYQRIMSGDLEERLRLQRRGEKLEVYRTERTFDTTEAAANNIGKGASFGGEGSIAGTVIGLGMAQPFAQSMGNLIGNIMPQSNKETATNKESATSKESVTKLIKELSELRALGAITDEQYNAKINELLSKI